MAYAFCVVVSLLMVAVFEHKAYALSTDTIIALTNSERQKAGLSPLQPQAALTQSAQVKALDMVQKNYWSHTAPDGTEPWNFIEASGYDFIAAGENLGRNFADDVALVNGWMNSPTHRANILNAEYQDIGLSILNGIVGDKQSQVVVVHYGKKNQPTPHTAASVATGGAQSTQLLTPTAPEAMNDKAFIVEIISRLKDFFKATHPRAVISIPMFTGRA